ncbi:MAG TPA: hypothetical protein VMF90_15190 [Rhizobiaceae bacterium]|nr:hypothetical protein [Rhizobiaceae bacterium]
MTTIEASPRGRRAYWLSLAVLVVALPAAMYVHSDGGVVDLIQETQAPLEVQRGEAQTYSGAEWRLTALTRLPGELPETEFVLAEFEAAVSDPAQFQAAMPCQVRLTDGEGRRWAPAFLVERVIRAARPDVSEKPRCLNFAEARTGDTIAMAESFVVPKEAKDLTLSLSLKGEQPESLLFD